MITNKVGRAQSPPPSFDRDAFQKRIDDIVGTRDGRPIIKLVWCPEEYRWYPHRMGDDPPGYIFPIFCNGRDENGELISPDRWALLERIEPEQFAPLWEAGRYSKFNGSVWDWKGPCPSEKYVELRAISYHNGLCCPCIGDECHCGEEYAHCWGKYAEPGEQILDWIRKKAWEARHDSDVNPSRDIRRFESTNAQRELKNSVLKKQEKEDEDYRRYSEHMFDYWQRKPSSLVIDGAKKTDSGIILLN